MVERGHSWLRVGNNMSAEGRVIVEEERKGSHMGRTKPTKTRKSIMAIDIYLYWKGSRRHFESDHHGASSFKDAEREGLNKDRGGTRRTGWIVARVLRYLGVMMRAFGCCGVMMQRLR